MWSNCFPNLSFFKNESLAKRGSKALLLKLSRTYNVSICFVSCMPQKELEFEVDDSGFPVFCKIEKIIGKSNKLPEIKDVLQQAVINYSKNSVIFIADERYLPLAKEIGVDFLPATEKTFRMLYNQLD